MSHSNEPLKSVWRALTLTCRDAARAMSRQLDQPLSRTQRLALRFHQLLCPWCRRYGRQLDLLHRQTKIHADTLAATNPRSLPPQARDRIKRKLRETP